ncbi:MAG: alpha/beta hydrolase [Planctomycetales bacterium]|nr:alpha/beta hydrolase [Planctomycetales bacterium]
MFREQKRCIVLIVCCGLSGGCASVPALSPLAPVERSVVFQPVAYPDGDWQVPSHVPIEDAWFEADDGTQLHGWFLPHPEPRGVALFCHGNAGNITSRGTTLWLLNQRHGLSIMTFDYRGYGRSEGTPSEKGILQDARAARSWLAERTGVTEHDIILMGRSLGGAVAVDLASRDGARGLVLASTFSSLPDVASHHMPWALPHWNMSMRLNSARKIRDYQGPLLQSHGDADEVIPIKMGRKLFDAAPGPKQFVVIANGGHNDPQSDEYYTALDRFLDSLSPIGTHHQQ